MEFIEHTNEQWTGFFGELIDFGYRVHVLARKGPLGKEQLLALREGLSSVPDKPWGLDDRGQGSQDFEWWETWMATYHNPYNPDLVDGHLFWMAKLLHHDVFLCVLVTGSETEMREDERALVLWLESFKGL